MKHLKIFAALCCAAMLFAACDKSNEPNNPEKPETPEDVYEYVDLGLPSGTLWATCNVGANSPEEYGDCFAWGETAPKTNYTWDTYKFTTDGGTTFTKYTETDGKITLDPEDDAAAVKWGGKWRMPTDAGWEELMNNCTWTWTTLNGVNGYEVTSKTNGNSIFLPAAGRRNNDNLDNAGNDGRYWSSSLYLFYPSRACYVYFSSDTVGRYYWYRDNGLSVRPVRTSNEVVTTGTENGHEYVDLGLPSGLKWATCNVGANSPEACGNDYAWGETETKDNYSWDTYKWGTATYNAEYDYWELETLTKYNTSSTYGTVDNKTTLDPEDDAAAVNWGGKWRMPTDDEWTELRENCTWTWTTLNGVNGYEVTSKTNGNSIFLPMAFFRGSDGLYYTSYDGRYWSSSLYTGSPYLAWYVCFYSDNVYRGNYGRDFGRSVRPVVK